MVHDDERKFIGNSVGYQYISSTITVLSGFIFYVYIVRSLDISIVGSVSLLLSISSLFTLFFSLDLGGVSRHFFSYHMGIEHGIVPSRLFRSFFLTGAVLGVTVFTTIWLLSGYLSIIFFHSLSYEHPLKLMSVSISLSVIDSIMAGVLLGIQKFKSNAILVSIQSTLIYLLPLIFYHFFSNLDSFIFGWILAGIFALSFALVSALYGTPYSHESNSSGRSVIVRYLIPVYLSSVIGVGSLYVDRLLVAYFMLLPNIAVYNLAIIFYSSLGFLIMPMNHIIMPKVSEKFSRRDNKGIREIGRICITILSLIYIPSAIGLAAISSGLLGLIGGPAYVGGVQPLTIMLFAGSLSVPSNILLQTLAGTRNTKGLFIASSVGLMFNIALSITLIPRYGLLGAALAYSSVGLSVFIVYVLFSLKARVLSFNFMSQVKILSSSVVMYGILITMERYLKIGLPSILIYIFVGAMIYFFMIKVLKPLEKAEVKRLVDNTSGVFSSVAKLAESIL